LLRCAGLFLLEVREVWPRSPGVLSLSLAFLIGHIYLATIGPTPWSHLQAMTMGRETDARAAGE
jgi:hypothetical protein